MMLDYFWFPLLVEWSNWTGRWGLKGVGRWCNICRKIRTLSLISCYLLRRIASNTSALTCPPTLAHACVFSPLIFLSLKSDTTSGVCCNWTSKIGLCSIFSDLLVIDEPHVIWQCWNCVLFNFPESIWIISCLTNSAPQLRSLSFHFPACFVCAFVLGQRSTTSLIFMKALFILARLPKGQKTTSWFKHSAITIHGICPFIL